MPACSNRQRVMDFIKRNILNGAMQAGDHVKEAWLAGELQVSRAPVREALAEMRHQGWLVAERHKGMSVADVSAEEVAASYTICSLLEGYIVASSLKLYTSGDLACFEALLEEMKGLSAADPPQRVNTLDLNFHDCIVSTRGDPYLVRTTREWINQPAHFLSMPYWHKIFDHSDCHERHHILYKAILSGDPGRVERSIREHYAESAQRITMAIRESKRNRQA